MEDITKVNFENGQEVYALMSHYKNKIEQILKKGNIKDGKKVINLNLAYEYLKSSMVGKLNSYPEKGTKSITLENKIPFGSTFGRFFEFDDTRIFKIGENPEYIINLTTEPLIVATRYNGKKIGQYDGAIVPQNGEVTFYNKKIVDYLCLYFLGQIK